MLSIRYPEDLPITARRGEIVAAIRRHQVVILAGETGSGKTTQLPKMCLEAAGDQLRGKIGCTQPRRVAAMSVSRRVAEELGVQWGREVGCKMRFNDDTSRETKDLIASAMPNGYVYITKFLDVHGAGTDGRKEARFTVDLRHGRNERRSFQSSGWQSLRKGYGWSAASSAPE